MVESSVLGTSPWNSDPFLCKDLNPFPGLDCLDMGLNETEITNADSLSFLGEPSNHLEKEHTERLSQDFLSGHDYLAASSSVSPVTSSLVTQESNSTIDDCWNFEPSGWVAEESSWLSDSSSEASSAPAPVFPSHNPRKKTASHHALSPAKSWSRMSGEEQLGTVEALTQIISHQMGLREQLEVINIIDPKAVISTKDTEFVIDLACLNDVKLQRIREYVMTHAQELGKSQGTSSCRLNGQGSRSNNSSGPSSLRSDTDSSTSSSGSLNLKLSKKQLREQHKQWKAWRQRQRKEQRQTLKERRSGLFVKNEILWLNAADDTDDIIDHDLDEDIDILA